VLSRTHTGPIIQGISFGSNSRLFNYNEKQSDTKSTKKKKMAVFLLEADPATTIIKPHGHEDRRSGTSNRLPEDVTMPDGGAVNFFCWPRREGWFILEAIERTAYGNR
jgi:hypothetical protein